MRQQENSQCSRRCGRDACHHRRRATKVVVMKAITGAPTRVAATAATVVALISTVGAPFKWSMLVWFW